MDSELILYTTEARVTGNVGIFAGEKMLLKDFIERYKQFGFVFKKTDNAFISAIAHFLANLFGTLSIMFL